MRDPGEGRRAHRRPEAAAVVNRHPEMFANRTVYQLDQIQTAPNPSAPSCRPLGPTRRWKRRKRLLTDA
jgi:hypothetical protein